MGETDPGDITRLLDQVRCGGAGAADRLMTLVYQQLRWVAMGQMAAHGPSGSNPTTVVHEAYLKLFSKEEVGWESRHHFFWAAARAMRDILIEKARSQATLKRGGDRKHVALEADNAVTVESVDLLAIDESLRRLEAIHPDAAKVVMLRFFAGIPREQLSELLGVSEAALWRQWSFAKAWLKADLLSADLVTGRVGDRPAGFEIVQENTSRS